MALPAPSSARVNLFGLIDAAVSLLLVSRLKSAWRSLYRGTDYSMAVGFQDLFMTLSAFYSQWSCDIGLGSTSPGTASTELRTWLLSV